MGFTIEKSMKHVFNLTSEKEKRRVLRNRPTQSENILWLRLRREQIAGLRFRRQYSVGAFVLDFFCPEINLAIEIDGSSHDGEDAKEYDLNRQGWIEQYGVQFLRFTNDEVQNDIETILQTIAAKAAALKAAELNEEV